VNNPLTSLRKVPAVGVLAERELGGFLALSALVGVGVGTGAAVLVLALEGIEDLIGPLLESADGLLDPTRLWLFLLVPTGLLIAWWVAHRFAPEIHGDGVPSSIEALAIRGGHIRGRVAPLKILTTAVTVGLGGSGGREGPIVQIGASVGSWISRRFKLGEDQIRSLVAAGAGAGIGASFNAPIAGMLFALEVILTSFAPRHMSSIVIASVAAAITSQSIVGPDLALNGGAYHLNSYAELFPYALLAVVIVGAGFLFLRTLDVMEKFAHHRAERLSWIRPVLAGLAVAALILVEPALFGTGQTVTNSLLLDERITAITGQGGELWWVLMLLALGKIVATSLTMSSGASAGAFMPSLFIGAAVGTGFARLVQFAWSDTAPLDTGAFAVVGMAAMIAVVCRAPLTAILLVFEVTGARDYGLILPLMLVATLATFLAERFVRDSVYSLALKRRGIHLSRSGEIDILDTVTVGSVMAQPAFVPTPDMTVAEVESMLHDNRSHGVPVVEDGELVGMVTISDLGRAADREHSLVRDVMTPRPVAVDPETLVSRALERMAALGVGRLPVVDARDPRRLVGLFRREEAVKAYNQALTATTDHHLHRLRLAQRTQPDAGYYDFRVPLGSVADGRTVRDVSWPEGSTLVSVRRNRELLVPTGDTELLAGDVVTAFGTSASRQRMIDRLNAGADEPTAEIPLSDEVALDDEAGDGEDTGEYNLVVTDREPQ
jgi:CIC family chloride channel protein